MAKIIGIDLGTTNSEAAYMEGGTPRIIPSAEGSAYGCSFGTNRSLIDLNTHHLLSV